MNIIKYIKKIIPNKIKSLLKIVIPVKLQKKNSKISMLGSRSISRILQLENKLWEHYGSIAENGIVQLLRQILFAVERRFVYELLSRYYISKSDIKKLNDFICENLKDIEVNNKIDSPLNKTLFSILSMYDKKNDLICSFHNLGFFRNQSGDGIFQYLNSLRFFDDQISKNLAIDSRNILNDLYRSSRLMTIDFYDKKANFTNIYSEKIVSKFSPNPKVTVVVSTFNSSKFISQTLISILNQSWQNIEVIVVDDCSSDSTIEIVKEFVVHDSRIKLLQNSQNLGTYAARNHALLHASGKYITVNDSDDWSHPQRIQLQVETLEADQKILGVMTFRVRVDESLTFLPRFDLPGSPILHNDYSSLMVSTTLAKTLGGWDPVRCSADAEFVDRIKHHYGPERIKKIYPEVPLSFSLYTDSNLTGNSPRGIWTKFYGSRKEYMDAAHHWQKTGGKVISRTSQVIPFPVPSFLYYNNPDIIQFDIVLVSDFRLTGGTNHCNFEYLREFSLLGYKVGLFHWPRYDVSLHPNRNPIIQQAMQDYGIIPIVWGDRVKVKLILFHHPPVLNWTPDKLPEFYPEKVGLLVNQSAQELIGGPENMYSVEKVNQKLVDLYGKNPEWIPISPTIRDLLADHSTSLKLSVHDWLPLVDIDKWGREPVCRKHERKLPIIGRHSRDHWAKWPKQKRAFDQAYCGNKKVKVQLMGGSRYPSETFLRFPRNWQFFEFNHTPGPQFVQNLDFFVNYIHEEAIEAFGRNVAEAMASGVPVLCSPQYKNCFGDAALYPEPEDVFATIQELWNNQELYLNQAKKGRAFVLNNCTPNVLQKHIQEYLEVKV